MGISRFESQPFKRVRYGNVFLQPQLRAGMWMEMPQPENQCFVTVCGYAPKKVKRRLPKEQESFDRQQKRQRTRRHV